MSVLQQSSSSKADSQQGGTVAKAITTVAAGGQNAQPRVSTCPSDTKAWVLANPTFLAIPQDPGAAVSCSCYSLGNFIVLFFLLLFFQHLCNQFPLINSLSGSALLIGFFKQCLGGQGNPSPKTAVDMVPPLHLCTEKAVTREPHHLPSPT